MKRAWQLVLLALLLGAALAVVLFLVSPERRRTSIARVQRNGSYLVPDGGMPGGTRVMADGKLALYLSAWAEGAKRNFYVFDPVSYSFTGYGLNPPEYPSLAGISDMVTDSTSTYVACSYPSVVEDSPELCIFSLASGDLAFSADVDYPWPEITLTEGRSGSIELAIGVDPYNAELFFLNLTEPGLLGEITLPTDYRVTSEWTGRTADYDNYLYGRLYFHFSSATSTLFLPLPHLASIYWCQIDLSSGFSYQDGTISCGVDPTFITAPSSGSPLYILDDEANKVFVLDPATRTINNDIDYESGTVVVRLIEHQDHLYLTATSIEYDPEYGKLIKINPVSEQQWSVDFVNSSPGDLSAFGGRIYVVKCAGPLGEETPTLLEYDANTLTQLSETFICDDGWSMDIIPQTGKGVVCDYDTGALYVVDLLSLGDN